jgi:hypothetical protein
LLHRLGRARIPLFACPARAKTEHLSAHFARKALPNR